MAKFVFIELQNQLLNFWRSQNYQIWMRYWTQKKSICKYSCSSRVLSYLPSIMLNRNVLNTIYFIHNVNVILDSNLLEIRTREKILNYMKIQKHLIQNRVIRVFQLGPVNRSRVKLYLKLKMVISRVPELELNQNALSLVKQDIFLNHLILQLLIRNILSRV